MQFDLLKETRIRYLFIKMFSVLFLVVLMMILYVKGFGRTLTSGDNEIITLIITSLWFLLVLSFLKKNKIKINNFIRMPSRKRFFFEVPLSLLLTYLGGIGLILIILFLVYNINPNGLDIVNSNLGSTSIHKYNSISIAIISFMGCVVIGPIAEEFIFRGVLLSRLYSKYSINKSIIYSSLLFFIMHLRLNPLLLFLGINCCILVYKYKSLIPSILLHITNNFIVFIRDLHTTNAQSFSNDLQINFSILIIGIILFVPYIFYVYKNFPKHQFLNLSNISMND